MGKQAWKVLPSVGGSGLVLVKVGKAWIFFLQYLFHNTWQVLKSVTLNERIHAAFFFLADGNKGFYILVDINLV